MKTCQKCLKNKSIAEFHPRRYKSGHTGVKSKCKTCRHDERMEWRASNPKDNDRNKAYNKANADEIRGKKFVKKYWPNMTWQEALAEWNRMYQEQNGLCAFGHKVKILHVDHCHKTGKVRGLLCYNCNNGIGRLKDDVSVLEKAIIYLKKAS